MRSRLSYSALALTLALGLAGCLQHGRSILPLPQEPRTYPPELRGALAPDSLPVGQPLTIKAYVVYGDCEQFDGFRIKTFGDSVFVTPLVKITGGPCPAIIRFQEEDCVFTPARSGPLVVVVTGGGTHRVTLPVLVGATPAALRRFDLRVLDGNTLTPVPRASVAIGHGLWFDTGFDTLAALVTDGSGHASWVADCVASDTAYTVSLAQSEYQDTDFEWSAPRCGVPERGTLFVWPHPVRSPAYASWRDHVSWARRSSLTLRSQR